MRATLLAVALCLLFYLFPSIDLKVSSYFYHNGFYLHDWWFAKFIYKATQIVLILFVLTLILLFFYSFITKKEIVSKKVIAYLLLVLALGPGLIVSVVFKEHFGRARPSQIVQFGGTKKFTPALQITNQCQHNCSFSSGHAAAAFYFLALVPLLRGKKRYIVALLALLWGGIVGYVRIIQGGHFLSDVVCSSVVVYLVAIILYRLMFERNRNEIIGSHTSNE
ncbi:phosphatase PAP2 family protein [Nitratiruptor sp. YY09-18]|uniref:phosphatase PAP2 family protein n=1 Tax=Nitratiruptor sp. YY09-18 TaxID=2724901 RepID=UPI001915E04F|nr:phosphatase PAP2 family protein [Nitratiruptor sp. YY09-18]BCD67894.1 lipid A 4'-phosphatase [Nitratiruptor sp. YY09-18]